MTKHALIIGAFGGIGTAMARQLAQSGWDVDTLSRSRDGFDIISQLWVDAHLRKRSGPYDLIFITTGILTTGGKKPEKELAESGGFSDYARKPVEW